MKLYAIFALHGPRLFKPLSIPNNPRSKYSYRSSNNINQQISEIIMKLLENDSQPICSTLFKIANGVTCSPEATHYFSLINVMLKGHMPI